MEDKTETEKGLELDKLDVLPPPIRSDEITPFPQTQDKGKVSDRRKGLTLGNLLAFVSKEKLFILAFLSGALIALPVVYLSLTRSSSDRAGSGDGYVGSIVYEVSSSIAERHHVRFKLSIPFSDNKEKARLMQELSKIKHELSISGSRPDVAKSIEQKDLKTLKKHILKIVNEVTGVSTKELHLKELALDPMAG
jgi:hypothetical protein